MLGTFISQLAVSAISKSDPNGRYGLNRSITIRAEANNPTTGSPLVPAKITFPQDDNDNKIGDFWEQKLVNELADAQAIDPSIVGFTQNGDHDYIEVDKNTGELNSIRGDGLSDHFEYRGGLWGPGVIDPVNPAKGFQKLVKTTSGPIFF